MKHKMQDLESKTAEFISKVDRLTIENESMKQTIIQLNSKIEFLTMKNNQNENLSLIQIDKHEKDTNKESNENKISNEVRLHINICKADIIESSNPFILLILKSQCKNDFHNTSVLKNAKNFFTTDPNDILLIVMFNEYADSNSSLIDEIEYPISDLRVGDPLVQKEFQITYNNKNFVRLYIEAQLFKTVKSAIKSFCTFAITSRNFIKQKFYRSLTCNLIDENRLGVCESCVMNCHKGHDLRYATDLMCGFFCDC